MLQLSEKMLIFEPSFVKIIRRHRGERLSFDPSENLENSKYAGEKSESRCKPKAEWSLLQLCRGDAQLIKSCFSCSSIYTAYSVMESAHVNTCRCELISFLCIRVFQDLQLRMSEGSHSLYISELSITKEYEEN